MKQMTIGFVTMGLKFSGSTLLTKGLGGSETALLCMAREFQRRGHKVSVFCETEEEGEFDGVQYYHHSRFNLVSVVTIWDVLVVSRWPEFLHMPTFAGLRVLWCHDTLVDRARLMQNVWNADQMMLLSDYHIRQYTHGESAQEIEQTKVPDLKPFMSKTSNGVDMDLIKANLRPKDPKKIIYTSRPERGLHWLLQHIWPRLLEIDPELKLYYANYGLDGMQIPEPTMQKIQVAEILAKQFGKSVVNMGHLPKDKLYQEISSAKLLLYPTDFPEISCITAMEAQACGTPIITTDDFALSETVGDGKAGYLIKGRPGEEEYNAKFICKVKMLLENDKLYGELSRGGPRWIEKQGYTWEAVAESWETLFLELMRERWENNNKAIVTNLVRHSDLCMARELAPAEQLPDIQKAIEERGEELPKNTAEVKRQITLAWKRFAKVAELLGTQNFVPSRIVDFASGDASFGYYMTKVLPSCSAIVVDRVQEVLDRVQAYVKNTDEMEKEDKAERMEFICTEDVPVLEDTGADLIFMGNVLDMVEEPWALIEEVSKKVTPGGYIAFTTRTGPDQHSLFRETHSRCWNFRQNDFWEMFGTKFKGHLSFVETDVSDNGDLIGYWAGVVPVPEGGIECHKIDPMRRALTVRPYQSVAACIIAYNEEDWVTMCLKRLRPLVDRIVMVIDPKTTDRTRELAEPFVDEFREVPFEDFETQRNASIENVEEDWIFWIDCDEKLVDGIKLRRYLDTPIMEGFSIKQNHLMLDVHGTFDIPVRILRNRPQYKFVGCIHEHCEDTSQGYDSPIRPSMLLLDIDLAHYGYLNERQRRDKCSNRNMALLLKDIEKHGNNGRMLTWVLAMRDYCNYVKWWVEKNGISVIKKNSIGHAMAEAAISTYIKFFRDPTCKHHVLAEGIYQEALKMLGISQIPYKKRKAPPFHVHLALAGATGGESNSKPEAKGRWFLDHHEFQQFMARQESLMLVKMGVAPMAEMADKINLVPEFEDTYDENYPALLKAGVDQIDELTGRLL